MKIELAFSIDCWLPSKASIIWQFFVVETCNFFSIILEDLRKPSGLAIDLNCGVIAVTDWCGDKLVFYSYSGSKLASYGGFKCPHSVSINNNHKVIVTDSWNNQLNVLHYQPKIWAIHMADFVL